MFGDKYFLKKKGDKPVFQSVSSPLHHTFSDRVEHGNHDERSWWGVAETRLAVTPRPAEMRAAISHMADKDRSNHGQHRSSRKVPVVA